MSDGDHAHSLQGRWLPASRYVWGGHVSPQFVLLLLLLHALVLGWFVADWNHVRMLLYGFYEVSSEHVINESPDDQRLYYPYQQDPVEALARYRPIALALVDGTRSATESARRIGDYLYSLRREPEVLLDEDLRFGPDVLYQKMLEGVHANCGQMSTVLATLWRSLGGHTRAVRWSTTGGMVGHYALELWDPEHHRWFYYDMNLNGFAYDDATGLPLSVASLRSNLLTGEHLHVQSHPTRYDYTLRDLQETVRSFPVEIYVLNNNYLHWSRDQRFGLFNRFYGALAGLPHPWDRIADNLTGGRDLRLVVQGRIMVAGSFSLTGARVFLGYLIVMTTLCLITLQRTSSGRPEGTPPPMAADTRPSQ